MEKVKRAFPLGCKVLVRSHVCNHAFYGMLGSVIDYYDDCGMNHFVKVQLSSGDIIFFLYKNLERKDAPNCFVRFLNLLWGY